MHEKIHSDEFDMFDVFGEGASFLFNGVPNTELRSYSWEYLDDIFSLKFFSDYGQSGDVIFQIRLNRSNFNTFLECMSEFIVRLVEAGITNN